MPSFQEYEQMKAEIKNEIMLEINPTLQDLGKSMLEIKQTLAPMTEILTNAKGFNRIAVWFLKSVIMAGAAFAVIYGAIKWLKQ